MSSDSLGGLVAILGAAVWGTGDFAGGVASRDRNPFQVLTLASFSGLTLLFGVFVLRAEAWPTPTSVFWSLGAGMSGVLGIAALYRGLATTDAARVAPTASVVGAAFPVLLGTLLHGTLGLERWIGILCGTFGIWLVTHSVGNSQAGTGLGLSVAAGLGFGGFFILIAQVPSGSLWGSLVVAKAASLLLSVVLLAFGQRSLSLTSGRGLSVVAGLLDGTGNALYLLAAQLTRFEIAAVLASMAPAATVLLAGWLSKQRVRAQQMVGVAFCLTGMAFLVA